MTSLHARAIAFIITLAVSQSALAQFNRTDLRGAIGGSSAKDRAKNAVVEKTPLKDRFKIANSVTVEVFDAYVDRVDELETSGTGKTVSKDKYIQLRVKLHNTGKAPAPYWSWAFHSKFPATLTDAAGNELPVWE